MPAPVWRRPPICETTAPVTELFISALISFFVLIDPPGCAPIFAGLTDGATQRERRSMAIRAVLIAGAILLGFGLVGQPLLGALGISMDAFRIAGGVMLFAIAIEMVYDRRTVRREERAEAARADPKVEDISVFPMAIPMIAGPGSIASIMLAMSRAPSLGAQAMVLLALALVLALTLVALLAAGPVMRVLGDKVEAAVTRLLGVILAALAAQFIIDGIRGAFSL